jgi:hypothetical protein
MDSVDGVGKCGFEFATGLGIKDYLEAGSSILADDLWFEITF